jgi:agmatine deiminase
LRARFHRVTFGDIWLRDTGPTFTLGSDGALGAVRFRFNGWGSKYELDGDVEVGGRVAALAGAPERRVELTFEGGGLEVDGEGTCLTTRQCVLNANRNATLDEARAAEILGGALGAERVVWIDRGLLNDHTDGHVDTLARFVAPGVVACMEARTQDDPNRDVLVSIVETLKRAVDARGRRLEVITVPSPGAVLARDGKVLPASYLNFYIANAAVLVPTYQSTYDDEAVSILERCFPGRTVAGSPARSILTGGGAFHCITQQEPLAARQAR